MSERTAIWALTAVAMTITVVWMLGLFLLGVRSGGLLVIGPLFALAGCSYGIGAITVHYGELRRRDDD